MLLKSVKKLFSNTGSITAQLTLFYSASTFMLITIISLFLYLAMTNILYNAYHQFLCGEIEILQNILKYKKNDMMTALNQEVVDVPRSLQSSVYHYYTRILDINRNTIVETPNMNNEIKHSVLFSNKYDAATKQSKWWQSRDGTDYLLMQSVVITDKDAKSWIVQIALDISYQQKVIHQYQRNMCIVLAGGALFSILIGYLIAKGSLRRLHELTETTKKITANSIQQRLDPKHWPKELNELGIAYNQMLDRIETSIFRLTELSDDLAHELRTPITNLMGEAEIALSGYTSVDQYQNLVESSLEELNRIYQIVENLLFLARAENPQIDLQKSLLNVSDEINVMCRFYQAVADDNGIKIYCDGNATLHANSVMFRRMIGNILSNALEYSSKDGSVYFNINEMSDKLVQITIRDDGIGITKENLRKVFQRFYRSDTAREKYSSGTGLGLSIVKSVLDLHKGEIFINSNPGKGTSITIHLPK